MIDEQIAQMRTHRNNIHRYLRTKLTELERQFIETRMAEEQSKLESLTSSTFPLAFKLPYQPSEVAAANDAPPG